MRILTSSRSAILLAIAASLSAAPAQAEILTFHTALDGKYGSQPTGSPATGHAEVKVDTDRQTVSIDLMVDGIAPGALWDQLVAAPIGPVHLHKYATAAGGDSVLVVPVPYGSNYQATPTGMRVTMSDYSYKKGAALLKSRLSFADFVTAMKGGLIVLNIHTDKFNPGEISGRVGGGAYPPPQPGAPRKH